MADAHRLFLTIGPIVTPWGLLPRAVRTGGLCSLLFECMVSRHIRKTDKPPCKEIFGEWIVRPEAGGS